MCHCEKPYFSEDCSKTALDCLNEGYFDFDSSSCLCKQGFYGVFCEKKKCLNDCSGNGICLDNGECKCNVNYKGDDCSISNFYFNYL